jgi:hypothetical protein
VPTADGDVVEENIAIRVTSGRRDGLVEQEPRPALGQRFTTSNAEPYGAPSTPKSWP